MGPRRSTWLPAVIAVLVAMALVPLAVPTPARAQDPEVYPIVFPVVGDTAFTDTFGACRDGCTRRHEGIDIMTYGWKGVPVVAAHAGTIVMTSTSVGRACCAIWGLRADDGWETWYIHLNNDTPGTDDGNGWGFAPGIDNGVHVEAGQLIGWVGDSGNAEHVAPHLHFELHRPDGTPIDPYPSLLAATRTLLPRVAGDDRYATAVAISQAAFPDGAPVVHLATGAAFPDALAAGPAAALAGGPVLLTRPGDLPAVVRTELERLAPDRIVVLGGEGAVAPAVVDALAGLGAEITRIAGADRFATAAAISAASFAPGVAVTYLADGLDFPDALAGAPAAAQDGAPLLLTLPDRLPDATAAELTRLAPDRVVVLGGPAAVSADVVAALDAYAPAVERVAGDDRYATAAAISARSHPDGAAAAVLATGTGFADALAGIALARRDDAPLLLVAGDVPAATAAELERLGNPTVTILGGVGAVPTTVDYALWDRASGNTMPRWR